MDHTKELLKELGIYVKNGAAYAGPKRRRDRVEGGVISCNPTTNLPIASVKNATKIDYENVSTRTHGVFRNQWRIMPAPKRGEVVREIGNELRKFKELLGTLVSLEMGKIISEGLGEVQEMIDVCDYAVGLSRQLGGPTMPSERPGHTLQERWHPLGPVGIITAFNFPVAVWAWNAAIAAVCGDTMIWKPSSSTPLCAIAVQNIVERVMAKHSLSDVFTTIIGSGKEVGELLINDPRVPLISFTGSIASGRHVAKTVAGRLGQTILELGGNNAIIVTKNANLDLATRAIVFGAIGTAGQRCTTTRRLIVHDSIVNKLTEHLVNAYEQIPIGDPLDEKMLMGPLVNRNAVESMMLAIEIAQKQGGDLLIGGHELYMLGSNFVAPAIVRMPQQTQIVRAETFAPILYVMRYKDMEEAIFMQNDVPQGLSSAIFTNDLQSAEKFISVEGSDCGIANVNIGTSGAEIGGAFGGEKETGGGRESGSDSWKAYMRRQTITVNHSDELPLAQDVVFDLK